MKSVMLALVCVVMLVVISTPVEADKLIGSCVWGGVDYTSNCNGECKRRGFRGGHCGSFANVNCWCET
ncbi:defensin ARD1 [Leguminivora glycinivorella]|uniref:defensin ARD1 n=1 Tax=Leguminivora glycinivorella TaxID=1035111 RepID=UPI002010418C|nr:defensin ARD1 [Leguminivora glycinivorella]